MQALLSFDKAPPFAAPLRFFLTAPVFAILAGLLLLVAGGEVLASRWMPATVAATHMITVGFMLEVMLGALVQILPVVAGANLTHPLLVARIVHAGVTIGGLALVSALLFALPAVFAVAVFFLAGAAAIFVGAAGKALWHVPSTSPTILGLKLALGGLAGVVSLGAGLALALQSGWAVSLPVLTDLHAGWGLAAWAGVLLVSMSYVVVPMFQLTPAYPARMSWWLPSLIAGLALCWSLAVALEMPDLARWAQGGAALVGMTFGCFTLNLQRQRRRARSDATYWYWLGGLISTLVALAMLLLAAIWPALSDRPTWPILFGILLGIGGYMSFIIGMLYKIIPFLSWLHLQNAGQGKVLAPNMGKILAEKPMHRQMRCHFAAAAMLALAVFLPDWLARAAGAAFGWSNAWLLVNLLTATGTYRQQLTLMAEKLRQ